jgi:hypothetical protein
MNVFFELRSGRAKESIALHETRGKNVHHAARWTSTLAPYVLPVLDDNDNGALQGQLAQRLGHLGKPRRAINTVARLKPAFPVTKLRQAPIPVILDLGHPT